MDRAQETEMVVNANVCAAVLRVGQRYTLIELDDSPMPDPNFDEWKGAEFCGVLAFTNGKLGVSLDEEIPPADMRRLCGLLTQLVAPKKGFVEYMRKLMSLPDSRD